VSVDPANNSNSVPVNAHYSIQFSKQMNPATLTPASFYVTEQGATQNVAGMIQVNADGLTESFIPNVPFPVASTFTVTVTTAVQDVNGNNFASGATFSFTTTDQSEAAAPQWISNSPASEAVGLALNAIIDIGFSESIDMASVLPNLQISAAGQAIPVQIALSNGEQRVTITPAAQLEPSTTYTVTVGSGISDLAGQPISNPGTFTFTTGTAADLSKPGVVSVDPLNGSVGVALNGSLHVDFSKAVDPVSLGFGDVSLYPASSTGTALGGSVAGALSVSGAGTALTFAPGSALEAETEYCATLSGVFDLEGNALSAPSPLTCFTTGVASDKTAPTVLLVSPPNGSTVVPLNAVVQAQLSAPVSVRSVGQSAIAVTAGGSAVSGTVTASGSTVVFTPSSALAASTAYTVKVSGFTDESGNTVTAFTSGFTTGTAAVTGNNLQATGFSPAGGSTGVSVTSPVSVVFSAPIDPLTVNAGSLAVEANGVSVAGTYAVSGTTVTFTPLTAYPGGATVTVLENENPNYYYCAYGYTQSCVRDVAGNTGYGTTSSFTTASTADTTPPKVLSVTPGGGAAGIGLNGQVVIVFSKSMNPAPIGSNSGNSPIALLAGGQAQGFTVSISADNRTVTLYNLSLPASSQVTVSIPATLTDLSGNGLAAYSTTFTTGAGFGQGSVVGQSPGNGATGVNPAASPVVLYANVALNAGTIPGAVHAAVNGQIVPGTAKAVGGQTIEFTPSSPWAYGALVEIFVDATAEDGNGNPLNAYRGAFTTVSNPETTAPAVVNYLPGNNASGVPLNTAIGAQYSEPLNASTVNGTTVYLINNYYGGALVPAAVALDATGTVVHLTPGAALAGGTTYCFHVQNVLGTNGLAAAGLGYCFTTGSSPQSGATTVVAASPANKLTGVPLNARIGFEFSAPVDPTTVTSATVKVSGGGTTDLPGAIVFSNNNQQVEVYPEAPLPASTAMTVTLNGVADIAGNAVAAQTTTFTTGTALLTATPTVIATTPADNAANVPVNSAISFQASAPLDATTLNAGTDYRVLDTTTSQYLAGTFSVSADGTAYFLPTGGLSAGHSYSVYLNYYDYQYNYAAVTDLAGNPIEYNGYQYGYSTPLFSFSTAASAQLSSPTGFPDDYGTAQGDFSLADMVMQTVTYMP
jgi:hypothetical protein